VVAFTDGDEQDPIVHDFSELKQQQVWAPMLTNTTLEYLYFGLQNVERLPVNLDVVAALGSQLGRRNRSRTASFEAICVAIAFFRVNYSNKLRNSILPLFKFNIRPFISCRCHSKYCVCASN
jgi:hypothetical protein